MLRAAFSWTPGRVIVRPRRSSISALFATDCLSWGGRRLVTHYEDTADFDSHSFALRFQSLGLLMRVRAGPHAW